VIRTNHDGPRVDAVQPVVVVLRGEWMDGRAHPTHGLDGAAEYLVVVVDTAGRFRDAYGPYGLAAARREAARRRHALWEAGEHATDVRIARHHAAVVPAPREPMRHTDP
jgi:hypothetical protein